MPNSYVEDPAQMVRPGDLLMSMANSRELVGKVALVGSNPPAAAFGGFLAALRPLVVSPRFLQLVLQDPRAKPKLIDDATQTTNIANISLGRLRPFRVPLPPLAEQERIVACVDSLMALSDRLSESLGAAEQLQSSLGRSARVEVDITATYPRFPRSSAICWAALRSMPAASASTGPRTTSGAWAMSSRPVSTAR